MIRSFRLAVCQLAIDVDDPEGNRSAVERAVDQAAADGAELIVLPELSTSGYVFADHSEGWSRSEALDGPSVELFRRLSARHRVVLVAGFCERGPGDTIFNSAVLVEDGELRTCYRKTHLWDAEKLWFSAGDEPAPVVATRLGRIAVMICYDLEFPEFVRAAALSGAELIAGPSNWPLGPARPVGERPVEMAKAQANAACNRVYLVVADRAGAERGQEWIGGSLVCDPDGYPITEPALGRAVTLMAEVDLSRSADKTVTGRNDAFGDRRPELYGAVSAPPGRIPG